GPRGRGSSRAPPAVVHAECHQTILARDAREHLAHVARLVGAHAGIVRAGAHAARRPRTAPSRSREGAARHARTLRRRFAGAGAGAPERLTTVRTARYDQRSGIT